MLEAATVFMVRTTDCRSPAPPIFRRRLALGSLMRFQGVWLWEGRELAMFERSGYSPGNPRRSIFRRYPIARSPPPGYPPPPRARRSEEHTSELQSLRHLVCRLL